MSKVSISIEGDVEKFFKNIAKAKIKKTIMHVLKVLDLEKVAVSFILTDNTYIQNINKSYRKKNRPTDVISFAYRENPIPSSTVSIEQLGDVFLSLEQAMIQSVEYKVTIEEECRRLIIHSILHLIGYDHEKSKKEEKLMQKEEDRIWYLLAD